MNYLKPQASLDVSTNFQTETLIDGQARIAVGNVAVVMDSTEIFRQKGVVAAFDFSKNAAHTLHTYTKPYTKFDFQENFRYKSGV